jgi:hypothetical protein
LRYHKQILWKNIKNLPFLTAQDEIYDDSLNSDLTNSGQFCMQGDEDESVLSCDIIFERQMIAQKLQIDFGVVENQAKEIRERIMKSKIRSSA